MLDISALAHPLITATAAPNMHADIKSCYAAELPHNSSARSSQPYLEAGGKQRSGPQCLHRRLPRIVSSTIHHAGLLAHHRSLTLQETPKRRVECPLAVLMSVRPGL